MLTFQIMNLGHMGVMNCLGRDLRSLSTLVHCIMVLEQIVYNTDHHFTVGLVATKSHASYLLGDAGCQFQWPCQWHI